MLTPEQQADILHRFFKLKQKERAIARELGINRKSVRRVIERKTVALGIKASVRASLVDPFEESIVKILEKDITVPAQVILQTIRKEGFLGGYTIVRERVQALKDRLKPKKAGEAFFRLDFAPGQAGQVDWGEFGDVFGDGVKIHCFVMVLCFSRLLYVEFVRSEKFEEFIRCHENAFRYFDGLHAESYWYDNLPAAVSERVGSLVRFNARFMAYCGHHHLNPHACNQARGNEKGRVENGIKYVRSNFWPGRTFMDFDDINRQVNEWMDGTANLREHQATRKVPRLLFDAEERSFLSKVNPTPYEMDEVFSKELRPDYHILYETNLYSAPWTLVNLVVTVRVSRLEILVYYRNHLVARHRRCYRKHQKPFTNPEHEKGLLEIKPQGKNAHLNWQLKTLESYGEPLKTYLRLLRNNNRSLKTEIARLLALATIYGETDLVNAVSEIIKLGVVGVERIEMWLKKRSDGPRSPAPLNFSNQNLSRIPARVDLRVYDERLIKTLTPSNAKEEASDDKESKR